MENEYTTDPAQTTTATTPQPQVAAQTPHASVAPTAFEEEFVSAGPATHTTPWGSYDVASAPINVTRTHRSFSFKHILLTALASLLAALLV